jgi:hypothetical protein
MLFLVARSAVYETPPFFRLSLDQPLIQAFLPEWPPFFNLNTEPHETNLFSGNGHPYHYYQHHLLCAGPLHEARLPGRQARTLKERHLHLV